MWDPHALKPVDRSFSNGNSMGIDLGVGHRRDRQTRLSINIWTGLVAIAAIAAGCARPDVTDARLVLTGSSTVAPLAGELAKRYEADHPGTRIDVQTGGSSRGIGDARTGVADIGMVSRNLKADESDLTASAIARDGIAPIVHRDNPVRRLTDEQISQIYQKQIDNWQGVGGNNAPIVVVNKAEGRSTLELFLQYFSLGPTQVVADIVIGDNEQGIKTVAGNPQAIGYVSIGAAEVAVAAGEPLALLPIEGVEASTATVLNGTFPLSRTLNLVTKGPPTGLAKEFVEFAQSPAADETIRGQYFVPMAADRAGAVGHANP